MLSVYRIYTRRADNSAMNRDGGDYDEWFAIVANESGKIVAGRWASSSDFSVCPGCGRYTEEKCCDSFAAYGGVTLADFPNAEFQRQANQSLPEFMKSNRQYLPVSK